MKLSNKKIKYIKRHATVTSVEMIAKELHISVKEVEKALDIKQEGRERAGGLVSLENLFSWSLIIIATLAPIIFLKGIYDFANLPQLAVLQAGVLFLTILWLLIAIKKKECRIFRSPFYLPVIAFLLWSLASLFWAHNRVEAMMTWMPWAASFLVFFLVLNGLREEKHRAYLLTGIFISGCFTAIIGIDQHLLGFSWIPQVVAPAATFANKNMAVHIIVLAFPLGVSLFLMNTRWSWDWVLALVLGLLLVFLIYSMTRAGWVAVAVEVFLGAILLLRGRIKNNKAIPWNRNKTFSAVFGIALFLVMINFGPQGWRWGFKSIIERTESITKIEAETPEGQDPTSIALRYAIYLNTLEMIKEHFWLGLGLGNHKVFYPIYHRRVVKEGMFSETSQLSNVHNDYLQIVSELGVVGNLLILWFFFTFIRVSYRLTSGTQPLRTRLLSQGMALSIIGIGINSLFCFPAHRAIPPFFFMILIAIMGMLYQEDEKPLFILKKPWIMANAAVIAFIVFLGMVQFHYRGIEGDRHYLYTTRLEKIRNWEGVIEEGKKVLEYSPFRVKILSYIGRAYVELGRHKEGVETLEKVIAAYPYHMNALLNIGVAYTGANEDQKAIEAYEKVLMIKPDYAKAHNNLANIYMKQKKSEEALKEFRIAADLDPKNSKVHYNVGVVAMQLKLYEEAAQAFENAVAFEPKWDLAHKSLGIIYFQHLHKRNEGIEHLKKALELNPNIKDGEQIRRIMENLGG